eukprot:767298-Hanusia_phi.AAC.3
MLRRAGHRNLAVRAPGPSSAVTERSVRAHRVRTNHCNLLVTAENTPEHRRVANTEWGGWGTYNLHFMYLNSGSR